MKCIVMKSIVAAMLVEAVQRKVLVSGDNHVAEVAVALLTMEERVGSCVKRIRMKWLSR